MNVHIRAGAHTAHGPNRETKLDQALALVSHFYEVPLHEMRGAGRHARAVFARHIAIYLTHVVCGCSLAEAGSAVGRHRSTAEHACNRIEDLRDDPRFDRQLAHIEILLRQMDESEVTG